MAQRDNILNELKDLQSSLVNAVPQNIYTVPGGYFDGLAAQVLNRIKALEADNAAEELNYLSPLLKSIFKKTPYSVPAGYFDSLAETMLLSVQNTGGFQTPAEELEAISPLLGGLKKEMPYSVPQGYFEGLNKTIPVETIKPAAKVVSIAKQKWFRYAAAAVVTGVIVTAGFLFINNNERIDPSEKSYAWVKKNLKKVSTDDIDEFVQLADEAAPVIVSVDVTPDTKNEIKELIKDISDTEIQDFLEETQAEEPESDDMLLN